MTEQKKPTRRAAPKKAAEAAEPKKVTLVKMVRDDGKTADVHPQEVENYRVGGYREA